MVAEPDGRSGTIKWTLYYAAVKLPERMRTNLMDIEFRMDYMLMEGKVHKALLASGRMKSLFFTFGGGGGDYRENHKPAA